MWTATTQNETPEKCRTSQPWKVTSDPSPKFQHSQLSRGPAQERKELIKSTSLAALIHVVVESPQVNHWRMMQNSPWFKGKCWNLKDEWLVSKMAIHFHDCWRKGYLCKNHPIIPGSKFQRQGTFTSFQKLSKPYYRGDNTLQPHCSDTTWHIGATTFFLTGKQRKTRGTTKAIPDPVVATSRRLPCMSSFYFHRLSVRDQMWHMSRCPVNIITQKIRKPLFQIQHLLIYHYHPNTPLQR